ncbi:MAG: divalent-cation tolerance protein CutA [Myxococcales bacterium]|nr:divalent-cation tolerance protein CutA [Myxococcales bacterium]MDH3484165.1 divalent-cation tolerance protein CutA [Myxococcales bacterium]
MTDPHELIVIFCTVPDDETAERLATGLVEERLAACVKVVPGVRSFYRWEGKIEVASEIQLLIKTRRSHFEAIEEWIYEQHPYEVPELVALPASDVAEPYASWVVEQTQ